MAPEGGAPTQIAVTDLPKLPLEQLRSVKEQLDKELDLLNDSVSSIRQAAGRIERASNALEQLSRQTEGKKVMVPLASSLYIPGELGPVKNVLIDVGTGYYIEKTFPAGVDYCQRKLAMLKGNHENVVELASQKGNQVEQVEQVIKAKLRGVGE